MSWSCGLLVVGVHGPSRGLISRSAAGDAAYLPRLVQQGVVCSSRGRQVLVLARFSEISSFSGLRPCVERAADNTLIAGVLWLEMQGGGGRGRMEHFDI